MFYLLFKVSIEVSATFVEVSVSLSVLSGFASYIYIFQNSIFGVYRLNIDYFMIN